MSLEQVMQLVPLAMLTMGKVAAFWPKLRWGLGMGKFYNKPKGAPLYFQARSPKPDHGKGTRSLWGAVGPQS